MTGQQIDRDRLSALADEYDESTIDGGPDAAAGAIRRLLDALDRAEAERDQARAQVDRVRALLDRMEGGGYSTVTTTGLRRALEGEA